MKADDADNADFLLYRLRQCRGFGTNRIVAGIKVRLAGVSQGYPFSNADSPPRPPPLPRPKAGSARNGGRAARNGVSLERKGPPRPGLSAGSNSAVSRGDVTRIRHSRRSVWIGYRACPGRHLLADSACFAVPLSLPTRTALSTPVITADRATMEPQSTPNTQNPWQCLEVPDRSLDPKANPARNEARPHAICARFCPSCHLCL